MSKRRELLPITLLTVSCLCPKQKLPAATVLGAPRQPEIWIPSLSWMPFDTPWLLALCQLFFAFQNLPAWSLHTPVVAACCHLQQSTLSLCSFPFVSCWTEVSYYRCGNSYGICNTCTVKEMLPIIRFKRDSSPHSNSTDPSRSMTNGDGLFL